MADPDTVNDLARSFYYKEVQGLVEILNNDIAADQPRLHTPDLKFKRSIGAYQGKRFSVTGAPLDDSAYALHLKEVLPSAEDHVQRKKITREKDWIAAN